MRFESQPEWSADGTRIAYHAKGGDDERLLCDRRCDAEDRRDRQPSPRCDRFVGEAPNVAPLAEVRLSPSAKRDSRFRCASRRPVAACSMPLPLEHDVAATADRTCRMSVGYPAWSPDERRLAVEIKDGSSTQAGVLDVETGVLRRLTDARGQTWVRSWSPDGLKVAAAVLREGQWSLRALDARGGRERAITPPGPPRVFVRYPDWSARGDLIVFERAEMTGNIWLLDRRPARIRSVKEERERRFFRHIVVVTPR